MEKRRGIIPALLAKHMPGMEPYAGELSMGVAAGLRNKGGFGKAKAMFSDKVTVGNGYLTTHTRVRIACSLLRLLMQLLLLLLLLLQLKKFNSVAANKFA